MSASWLITDGFSGEAGGVSKIVTMGLYSSATPPAPVVTFNNSTQNWISPTMHLGLLLGLSLWSLLRAVP
jgi:hypothetical protein